MVDLPDSVSLVTGAASGIGRATALALAREGSHVVVADIDGPGTERTAAEIEKLGPRALAVRTDVGKRNDVEDLVAKAIDWQGRCDLFISNAGVGCRGEAHEFTVDEWEELIAINLWASIWATRLLVPHMLERGSGHLAFVSSGCGLEGIEAMAPYSVAKFGLVGLGESLARALQDTGVGVSIIVPGAVATNGWRIYRFADAANRSADEINEQREEIRKAGAHWPTPEAMADKIIEGLKDDRIYIFQDNPYEADWYGGLMRKRAADPDGFVLRR